MDRSLNSSDPQKSLQIPSDQEARQATASLGGHLFQATRAATEWSRLPSDAQLLLEIAEDYAVLVRRALHMTQIKHEFGGSVTLRSDGVRKSISGLLSFQEKNPDLEVSLAYLTTAEPGREADSPLPSGIAGLTYWQEAARGADVNPLRQLLLDTQLDERVLNFVRECDDDTLRERLVHRVNWLTGSPALSEAHSVLQARLRSLAIDRTGYADDGDRALPFIVQRVLQTSIGENRVLTQVDFEEEWQRATTVAMSVAMVRQLATLGGAGDGIQFLVEPPLPSLSARIAPRQQLVDRLRSDLQHTDILWLHGSNGLGKSQLTRLITAGDNGNWAFVSLKGCSPEQQESRLRSAVTKIDRDDFAGIILDDLPVPAPEGLRHWIAAASLDLASIPRARILVTSEREPLPAVRKAFEPLRILVRDAPYFQREDVEYIVTAAGGDANEWAALIHLTCGGGHPLMVDARVAGLASKGWPTGERLSGLGIGREASEITDVRQEVSLRLLDELSADAHQLLLRLTALSGNFDRQLANAVAAVEPAIARSGVLLDYLNGPWIEQKHEDRFSVSPLLTASAASLSSVERQGVVAAAIADLTRRNPFPGDMLSALIIYSIITRHAGGFGFVARAVIETAKRSQIATQMFPLLYMKSGKDGLLFPEHPGISAMLRLAQVMAAINDEPPRMVGQVVEEALKEARAHPEPIRGANGFTALTAVLGHESADLRPNVWMPMLVRYHDDLMAGRYPKEMTELMSNVDLGGLTPDQLFFVVRSNKVDTVADVEELFDQLDSLDPKWRHRLLTAAPKLLKGPPLFVQKGWSSETSPMTLDAPTAEAAYARLAKQASRWGEDEIAIECIRSRVVILDEYLGRHEEAMAVLDEADRQFGRHERLIRSRATVLATMGQHEGELELLSELGPAYSEEEPLERLMMLRTTAMSAGRLGRFEEAASFFHQAHKLIDNEQPEVLACSVRSGLLADAAVMEFRDDRPRDAVSSLFRALQDSDDDRCEDETSLFALAAITHVIQWMATSLEGQPFPEDPSMNPGVCSTLRPTFDPTQTEPRVLNQELYLLARLEAIANVEVGAQAQLLAKEQIDGVQLKIASGVAMAQIEQAIENAGSDPLFSQLSRYAWLSGLLMRSGGADATHHADDEIEPVLWKEAEGLAARAAVSGLIAMLILNARPDEAARVAQRAHGISPYLGEIIPAEGPANEGQREFFQNGVAVIQRLQTGEELSPDNLLRITVDLFVWARHIGARALHSKIFSLLAKGWLDLAERRRALLTTPSLAAPAIEAAAASKPGIGGIARLVEAGQLASSLRLPAEVIEMLKVTK